MKLEEMAYIRDRVEASFAASMGRGFTLIGTLVNDGKLRLILRDEDAGDVHIFDENVRAMQETMDPNDPDSLVEIIVSEAENLGSRTRVGESRVQLHSWT